MQPTYTIEVQGGAPNTTSRIQPWQRLRAFQTRLVELLAVPEDGNLQVADIGCVRCPGLDPVFDPQKETWVAPEKPPSSVEYILFTKDRERLTPIFREALVTVKGDPLLDDVGFRMTEHLDADAPDCGGYPSPCNPRPVCTMYGGCSRSAYSCKKCY
ncbi:MAG: hypothetical protein IT486_04830 [Gammaproteobacteria bacterium]|nr:hypothetical protein [Gammaproteobacteria bacterium]